MKEKFTDTIVYSILPEGTLEKCFKYPFSIMCKKFGKEYISFCKACWVVSLLSNQENESNFCYEHDLPKEFFENNIKKTKYNTYEIITVEVL